MPAACFRSSTSSPQNKTIVGNGSSHEDQQVTDIMRSIGLESNTPPSNETISTDPGDPEIFVADENLVAGEEPAERFREHPIVKMAITEPSFEDAPGAMKTAAARILSDSSPMSKRQRATEQQNWVNKVHNTFLNPCPIYDRDRAFEYLQNDHFMSHAIVRRILREIKKRCPGLVADRVLDFGAGTGAGAWAAVETFTGNIHHMTCVEPAPFMRDIGEKQTGDLLSMLDVPEDRHITWQATLADEPEAHSLTLACFVLREVHEAIRKRILDYLWASTAPGGVLLLTEFASAEGSSALQSYRTQLLELYGEEARIVAPCPHSHACPWPARYSFLSSTTDKRKLRQRDQGRNFCHFGQRVMMDAFPLGSVMKHRPRTGSRLRFQHEHLTPFVYLVLQKAGESSSGVTIDGFDPSSWSRLIRPPIKRGGHVILDVCQASGSIDRQVVSRRKGAGGPYKLARLSRWADLWPYSKAIDDLGTDGDNDNKDNDVEHDRD